VTIFGVRPTPLFKNFFRKEVEEIPLEEEMGEYLDRLAVFDETGENIAALTENTQIYVKPLYPTCLEDISQIEQELKRGHILIVHLTKLYEKPRECMRAIEQVRGILNFVGGDLGHIEGTPSLIITPSFIRIWRGG
jgi:SepF-like predicted cell division protein (DUF552 family)